MPAQPVPPSPLVARQRETRRALAVAALGLAVIAVAIRGARAVLDGFANTRVSVRQATAAEAPSPAHAVRTVVAAPDGTPSALPLVRNLVIKLVGLAVCAALGAAQVVWGLSRTLGTGPGTPEDPVPFT